MALEYFINISSILTTLECQLSFSCSTYGDVPKTTKPVAKQELRNRSPWFLGLGIMNIKFISK